jgi:hypothetical protein
MRLPAGRLPPGDILRLHPIRCGSTDSRLVTIQEQPAHLLLNYETREIHEKAEYTRENLEFFATFAHFVVSCLPRACIGCFRAVP